MEVLPYWQYGYVTWKRFPCYTPPHDSGWILWFHIGRPFNHPSFVPSSLCAYFYFWTITWVHINGFSPNFVSVLILWWSDLGLLIGKFRQSLTELSVLTPSGLYFVSGQNLSKYQCIFTNLGTCIGIVMVLFGIANRQILSSFDRIISPSHNNGGVLSMH